MRRLVSPTLRRFLVVGGLAYIVNQALLVALYEGAGLGLLPASVLALEASIMVRFGLNDRWTFRSRCGRPLWQRFSSSNLSSFGGPLIALACVNLLTPALGVSYLIANSIGITLGLAWNWLCSNRLVWADRAAPRTAYGACYAAGVYVSRRRLLGLAAPALVSMLPGVAMATEEPKPRRVAVSEDEIFRGPPDRPYVSLVINAGAGRGNAEEILDVLASRGVRTTFFMLGYWAEQNADVVRRIQAGGHEIASHGHAVFDLTAVSDADVISDLELADTVISAITGQTTRPLWSPSAGYRDARVRRIAARLGYRPILWSHDAGDWPVDATAAGVRQRATAGAEPGSIVVFHFDSTHSRNVTANVLGEVIDYMRSRGLEPVTISELVGE